MNENKSNTYTQTKKIICDWIDKKKYLIRYRIVKLYVRHGMICETILEKISIRQNKGLEKCLKFNTQKRNKANNDFRKHFYI